MLYIKRKPVFDLKRFIDQSKLHMKNKTTYLLISIITLLYSCNNHKNEVKTTEKIVPVSTDLAVDHFNIWVKDPQKAKEQLTNIGFSAVPDSLSAIHHGQGTAGRYFNFLNGYLELIFVYDQNELEENNAIHTNLDFTDRANFEQNGASPFSIALKVKNYAIDKIPFEKVRYHQDWMGEDVSIYAAKNSKTHLNEPSIFVVYPEIESKTFNSYSELNEMQVDSELWRQSFHHPNGAEKITNIIITSTDLAVNSETIKAINGIENISVKSSASHLMEVYFDNNIQRKSFDLRPELPLIIYL